MFTTNDVEEAIFVYEINEGSETIEPLESVSSLVLLSIGGEIMEKARAEQGWELQEPKAREEYRRGSEVLKQANLIHITVRKREEEIVPAYNRKRLVDMANSIHSPLVEHHYYYHNTFATFWGLQIKSNNQKPVY